MMKGSRWTRGTGLYVVWKIDLREIMIRNFSGCGHGSWIMNYEGNDGMMVMVFTKEMKETNCTCHTYGIPNDTIAKDNTEV